MSSSLYMYVGLNTDVFGIGYGRQEVFWLRRPLASKLVLENAFIIPHNFNLEYLVAMKKNPWKHPINPKRYTA